MRALHLLTAAAVLAGSVVASTGITDSFAGSHNDTAYVASTPQPDAAAKAAKIHTLTGIAPAKLWVSSVGGEAGEAFDLRAEFFNGKAAIATTIKHCVTLSPSASRLILNWPRISPRVLKTGTVLAIRISARAGTIDGGIPCGSTDTTAGAPQVRISFGNRGRSSAFGLTITPSKSTAVYLQKPVHNASLTPKAPPAGAAAHRDSAPLDLALGTWSVLGKWKMAPYAPNGKNAR